MQYTENYQFRKPVIGIDVADVKDINFNSDKTDTLIHNTQISLAPAYDLNETYDTGDVVMYETLMYKCKADNTTGAWDASKWERTTAGEEGSGGGGSSVIPNPQGEPTDTLNTIGIDGTIFDIAGSGGGGSSTRKDILYTNSTNSNPSTITLSNDFDEYDLLSFRLFRNADNISENSVYSTIDTQLLSVGKVINLLGWAASNEYVLYSVSDVNELSLTLAGSNLYIREIAGIKIGAGGGTGVSSEVIPITAGDGTTSRTFTFDKIPKKISMQYVANGWGLYRDIIWGTDRSYYQTSQATISESATYIGVSGIVCDETTKSVTITGLNAIQASNTADIVGYMYVDYGGGSGGSAVKDILYSDANGAPHLTDVALAHNIFDYDEVYFKVSNPTDIQTFNAYTQQVFMPMMYNTGERWGIQALYDQRVVEITFASDGLSFQIVRTAGDYSNNTVYEVIGIKH